MSRLPQPLKQPALQERPRSASNGAAGRVPSAGASSSLWDPEPRTLLGCTYIYISDSVGALGFEMALPTLGAHERCRELCLCEASARDL